MVYQLVYGTSHSVVSDGALQGSEEAMARALGACLYFLLFSHFIELSLICQTVTQQQSVSLKSNRDLSRIL
ncbi:hypothetical protein P692DRAFT_20342919 [Suillus brevipes Sb2]|nr:hypothetical protein P692DRAFT_20342919 [Suillus brevipes Sb2]